MTIAPSAKSGSSPGAVGTGVVGGGVARAADFFFFGAATVAAGAMMIRAATSSGRLRKDLAIDHRPGNRRSVLDDFFINVVHAGRGSESDQVRQRPDPDPAQLPAPAEGARGMNRHGAQRLLRRQPRLDFAQPAQLLEKAQRIGAREAVRADA